MFVFSERECHVCCQHRCSLEHRDWCLRCGAISRPALKHSHARHVHISSDPGPGSRNCMVLTRSQDVNLCTMVSDLHACHTLMMCLADEESLWAASGFRAAFELLSFTLVDGEHPDGRPPSAQSAGEFGLLRLIAQSGCLHVACGTSDDLQRVLAWSLEGGRTVGGCVAFESRQLAIDVIQTATHRALCVFVRPGLVDGARFVTKTGLSEERTLGPARPPDERGPGGIAG